MVYPSELVVGVWRYKQISGSVYVRYNEHTKKLDGLSTYNGGKFEKCGLNVLIGEVNESERKGKR